MIVFPAVSRETSAARALELEHAHAEVEAKGGKTTGKMLARGKFSCMLWLTRPYILGITPSRSSFSTSSDELVQVTREGLDDKYTIAHMSFNRPPVNSFDMGLSQEFSAKFHDLTRSGDVHAVVLKSSVSKVFSAGLDFKDLCGVSEAHLREFWKIVREMWYMIYTCRLTTLAAINGHCLAGGTLIAAACDHRICAQGDYKIGVTAAKIGLVPPHWFLGTLTHLTGQRVTEMCLQQGRVFQPEDAVKAGLMDEVCEKKVIDDRCREALLPYLETCHETRAAIKLSLRRELIESYHKLEEKDTKDFVQFTLRESTQRTLASISSSN